MEVVEWIAKHWFDLFQTVGIVGSLLFTAYTIRQDGRARRISNSIAITEQYRENWKEFYGRPELSRVLASKVNLATDPVSNDERLFVSMLILHLSTVYRAMKEGEFVALEGLPLDVYEFFSLPIPQAVWSDVKRLHDQDFMDFVEACLAKETTPS